MKKSVKEQLEKHAVTPYPRKGWQSEFVVPVSVAMRILASAVDEAWNAGVAAELHCGIEGGYREQKRKDLERIINGPKKARGK